MLWERTKTFALILLSAGIGYGADLKPATQKAWENYLNAAHQRMIARLRPDGCFLWAEENAGRMQRLRNGEIVVSPASEHDPRAIPGGLIHHWIGAVFIPDASIKDVLSTVEDYDRYGSFYPGVVASELISRDGPVDRFWTVEKHKALFSRFALDAVFVSTYHDNPGSSRAYSTSETVRLQQIDHYGDPDQHELGPYAPSAYLWCLNTISRYEERDGGVYLELEAIGLSRGIPDGLHWLVDPFVRHAAAEAMTVALRQTRQAVLDNKYPAPAALTSGAAGFRDR